MGFKIETRATGFGIEYNIEEENKTICSTVYEHQAERIVSILENFEKIKTENKEMKELINKLKRLCENCNNLADAMAIVYGHDVIEEHGCNKWYCENLNNKIRKQEKEIEELKNKLTKNKKN